MRKIVWIVAGFLILFVSAVLSWGFFHSDSPQPSTADDEPSAEIGESYPNAGFFPIFSLNVHDWGNIEESIAAVERVLDIHEKNNVPLDIYFTDPLFRLFVERDPELIERLRDSTVATVAYHIRPPVPYYPGFDWLGLEALEKKELYDLVMEYETHALDLSTAMSTGDPGGYAYVAKMMGYAPIGVGIVAGGRVGETVAQVYKDLGATFMVAHGDTFALGQTALGGLLYRPEDIDLKIYEQARRTQDGGEVIEKILDGVDASSSRVFLGIKYHEVNYYYFDGTPWWPVYFNGIQKDNGPRLDPPYDTSKGTSGGRMQTSEEIEQDWTLYESAVQYVAEHPDAFHPVNLRDLANMVEVIPI